MPGIGNLVRPTMNIRAATVTARAGAESTTTSLGPTTTTPPQTTPAPSLRMMLASESESFTLGIDTCGFTSESTCKYRILTHHRTHRNSGRRFSAVLTLHLRTSNLFRGLLHQYRRPPRLLHRLARRLQREHLDDLPGLHRGRRGLLRSAHAVLVSKGFFLSLPPVLLIFLW